jgi:hypothetical protein
MHVMDKDNMRYGDCEGETEAGFCRCPGYEKKSAS